MLNYFKKINNNNGMAVSTAALTPPTSMDAPNDLQKQQTEAIFSVNTQINRHPYDNLYRHDSGGNISPHMYTRTYGIDNVDGQQHRQEHNSVTIPQHHDTYISPEVVSSLSHTSNSAAAAEGVASLPPPQHQQIGVNPFEKLYWHAQEMVHLAMLGIEQSILHNHSLHDANSLHSMHSKQRKALIYWNHVVVPLLMMQQGLTAYMQQQHQLPYNVDFTHTASGTVTTAGDMGQQTEQQQPQPQQQLQQQQQPQQAIIPVSSSSPEYPTNTTDPQEHQQQRYNCFEPPTSSSVLTASNLHLPQQLPTMTGSEFIQLYSNPLQSPTETSQTISYSPPEDQENENINIVNVRRNPVPLTSRNTKQMRSRVRTQNPATAVLPDGRISFHAAEYRFRCLLCGKFFQKYFDFSSHMERHVQRKPYKCTHAHCHKEFYHTVDLKQHVEFTHYNLRNNVCESQGNDRQLQEQPQAQAQAETFC